MTDPKTPAPKNTGKWAAGTAAVAIALAATLFMPSEGKRNVPYRDIVGVLTVCYGHTGNVENRRYSDVECEELVKLDLMESYTAVHRCIPGPIPLSVDAALVDATANLGPRVVCGSTIQKMAVAGKWKSVCAGLFAWINAGGEPNHGIANRRVAERELCLRDIQ